MRIDRALVELGLARSRADAQEMIALGRVRIGGRAVAKPSLLVEPGASIEADGSACPYVSRGGIKLAAALDGFGIDPTGRQCLDVGAGTGGFTDCMLRRGAASVTAIDVGHDQMSPTLAGDPRVLQRDGVNARDLRPSDFTHLFDLVVADVSFISLTLVLPALANLAQPNGDVVVLVKPQFEVGQVGLGKGGIVRDPALRDAAVGRVIGAALSGVIPGRGGSSETAGLNLRGRMASPITGGDGNQEFLVWFGLNDTTKG